MYSGSKLGSPTNLLGIAAATVGVLAWCFGLQTWDWYQAKKMGESQPCLRLSLRPIPTEAADAAPGARETFFGYEFEVPWPNVEAKVLRQTAVLTAQNGQGLIFLDPATTPQLFDDASKPVQHPNMKDAFGSVGKEAAQSNYDLTRHTLDVVPEQISPILPKREANGRLTLLHMKSVLYCNSGHPAFYSFQRNGLNCLQVGELGVGRVVEVKCFDGMDRELNFHFSTTRDASALLTQREINRVIQTLRPAEKASVGPSETTSRNTN
jgi:hypothetical protein